MPQQEFTLKSAIDFAEKLEAEKNKSQALDIYTQIITEHPQFTKAILNRAQLYNELHLYKESIADYEKLLELESTQPLILPKYLIYCRLADNFLKDRAPDIALSYYEKSIEENPLYDVVYVAIFNLLEHMNKLDESIEAIKEKVKELPDSTNISYLKARISFKENKPLDEIEKHIKQALELGPSESTIHIILSDYANIHKKRGQYKKAFSLMEEAKQTAYKTPRVQRYIDNKQKLDNFITKSLQWPNLDKASKAETNNNQKAPIFLVGFPRSGTTLAEQILFTRPDLTVTDELSIIDNIIHNPQKVINQSLVYPTDYISTDKNMISKFREAYYTNIQGYLNPADKNKKIVDKNPYATIYLGIIQQWFPDSKIIMMIRDPRDACISCFFQTFVPNASNLHFYSLANTIEYYTNIMNLYLHFKKNLSLNIIEMRYEDICTNFEQNTQKMIEFIGEKWDDKVLEFYKQERYITTPSHNAVSNPINTKAIGQWKNYEEQLTPYLAMLEPFLKEFGYKK